MLGWLKVWWLTVLGAAITFIPGLYRFAMGVLDWGGRIDLLENHTGAVGPMWAFLINPPAWFPLATALAGLALIWWDFNRRRIREPKHDVVSEQVAAVDRVDAEVIRAPKGRAGIKFRFVIDATSIVMMAIMAAFLAYLLIFSDPTRQASPPSSRPEPIKTVEAPPAGREAAESFNYSAIAKRLEGLNGLEAQRVQELYIGRLIQIAGRVRSVRELGDQSILVMLDQRPARSHFGLIFPANMKPRLSLVSNDDTLAAVCRIKEFLLDGLYLTDCELP